MPLRRFAPLFGIFASGGTAGNHPSRALGMAAWGLASSAGAEPAKGAPRAATPRPPPGPPRPRRAEEQVARHPHGRPRAYQAQARGLGVRASLARTPLIPACQPPIPAKAGTQDRSARRSKHVPDPFVLFVFFVANPCCASAAARGKEEPRKTRKARKPSPGPDPRLRPVLGPGLRRDERDYWPWRSRALPPPAGRGETTCRLIPGDLDA